MKVTIPYGNETIDFDVPEHLLDGVYSPSPVTGVSNPLEEVERAIENPIGSPKLEDILFTGCTVSIICDDITRPTPAEIILKVLLPKLHACGVQKEDIKIIMALGTHRYMTNDEMIQKVGYDTFHNYHVINSEFNNKDRLMNLGQAEDGVEIWATMDAMESDIRIAIGNIVPHPAVGWSGGGKIIYPGITGKDTVSRFHIQHGLVPQNMFGMDESPVRIQMEKWVDKVGLHFIINTIITPKKELVKVVAGHYVAAHREGVKHCKQVYGKKVDKKSDIVIVSAYPADMDFWQATKGVTSGEHIVADGGCLILVSPCYEGLGPHHDYLEHIGNDSADKLLIRAESGEAIEGSMVALAAATTISRMRKRIKIALVVPTIEEAEARKGKLLYFNNIETALKEMLTLYPEDPRIAVVTHGSELYVYV